MAEIWVWLTQLGNSKIVALFIFFPLFLGIVIYVYSGRSRSQRLETYKYIPLLDDDQPAAHKPTGKPE